MIRWSGDPRVAWSVEVRDAASDDVLLSVDADVVLPTASVAKVLLLLEVARRLADGSLATDQPLDRRVTPRVGDSGLWQHLSTDVLPWATWPGSWPRSATTGRPTCSVDLVGLPASGLLDLVRDQRGPADPPVLSLGNAAAWSALMGRLHRREDAGAELVLDWLASGVDHSLVASAYVRDPLVADPLVVTKTGSDEGVRADVGLVPSRGRTVAYAAIAQFPPDLLDVAVGDLRRLGAALR